MSKTEFKHTTNHNFNDISSEAWRQYEFDSGAVIRIDFPEKLSVSENGHRIFDATGISHYVPFGWIHLSWKAKEGAPNFAK